MGDFLNSALGKTLVSVGAATAASATSTTIGNSRKSRLAEYAHQQDINQWNRQNAYNHPAMQMERLKNAGLNPNLVYGSGSVTGNVSGQLPKYTAPGHQKVDTPTATAMLGQYSQQRMLPLQVNQAESTIAGIDAETANKNINSIYLKAKADNEGVKQKYAAEMAEQSLQAKKNQNEIFLSTDQEIKARTEFMKYKNELAKLGIYSSDNKFVRMFIQSNFKGNLDQYVKKFITNRKQLKQ